jgi:hypothetical protein
MRKTLRAGGDIFVVAGFQQAGNLPLQGADFFGGAFLHRRAYSRLPLKQECVHVHSGQLPFDVASQL